VEYPGEQEPIVPRDLWDRVQQLLSARARTVGKGRGGRPRGQHLLTQGLLRCGYCSEAMLPRTLRRGHGLYEVYLCGSRVKYGRDACPRTPVRRRDVDEPLFEFLKSVVLDMGSIREQVQAEHERRYAEAESYLRQAEDEEQQAVERLARVKRHFIDDKITPDEWHQFSAELGDELQAARTKADLMRQRLAAISETRVPPDAVLELLARLRAAVSGRVQDAQSVDALRAVLMATFERVELHQIFNAEDPADFELRPIVRPEATRILDRERQELAVLRRLPLTVLETDEYNIALASSDSSQSGDGDNVALTT
jgi:hypothetical protein